MVVFMALICVGQEHKTVFRLSSGLLNSSGWKPNNNTYLVSSDGTFCAGFYNMTPDRYAFAVWYANDSHRTLAWMANSTSLVGGNSSLTLRNGSLSISDDKGVIAWMSKDTPGSKYGMDLILQDSGNLVFNQWESFKNFPTFTLLPTQNFSIGNVLMSRLANGTYGKDSDYYYSLSLDEQSNKLSLYWQSEKGMAPRRYWQSDGSFPVATLSNSGFVNTTIMDTGIPIMASDWSEKGVLRRLTLDGDGNLRMYSRKRNPPSWVVVWESVLAHCKIHGTCGENAVCKVNTAWKPTCVCPPGFDPSPPDNRSCKPNNDIKNSSNVTFVALDYVNFDGWNSTEQGAIRLQDCMEFCGNNTSCVGFARNLDNGNCVYQLGKLVNGYWSPEAHTRMYLKISAISEEAPNLFNGLLSVVENVCPTVLKIPFPPNDSDHTTQYVLIISSFLGAELLCGVYVFHVFLRKYSKFRDVARLFRSDLFPSGTPKKFSYGELKAATNNFSDKLGEGGFGPVYRGLLRDQRQIAVKKLKGLNQGERQFWAEVNIIGRIHHLNLVRMWGFCAEGEHRMLVYEYIPNGSLEKHLFNREGDSVMEWGVRYRIALGIARAIAYLHEECLEWVLHCDIKPENILVDENFCPKVSDFGLAKLVEKDSILNVSRIGGTRGYLAPEWFQARPVTAKVDVYSFGMMLFEMVSGKRNLTGEDSEFYYPEWAFQKVVDEGKAEEVVDERMGGIREKRREMEGVRRVVKTALWCIQSRAEERPSMGKVAKMLEGSIEIEDPPKPSLFQGTGGSSELPFYSGMNFSIKSSELSRF